LLVILYAVLSKAHIPINRTSCPISGFENSNILNVNVSPLCVKDDTEELELSVSFPIFMIGFMSFISWFFFCVFGGIGLAALPLDFFYDFCTRPEKRTLPEMERMKGQMIINAQRIKNLALDCKDMESKEYNKRFFMNAEKRKYNSSVTKLRAATYLLDKDHKMYKIQTNLNDEIICHYYFGLLLGILCSIVSLVWIIHV
jgi:LMBR1 domain-containing protein 1